MAQDISVLGLAIDSAPVVRARDELGRFVAMGDKAAGAATKVESGANKMSAGFGSFKGVLAGLALGATVLELIKMADAMTLIDARLKIATGDAQSYAKAQSEVYRIAQQSNAGLTETATLFTKLHEPVKRLGGDVGTTGKIVEAFSASLRVGGASTQEAASATLQFAQAMGSGRLQGDEFRAIAEASPRFMKALAEGMGVPIEKLKEMGSEGKLTADVVGNALVKSLDVLQQEMKQVPDTVGGAMTRLTNDFKLAINDINKASGTTLGLAGGLEEARKLLPSLRDEAVDVFKSVGEWIETNKAGLTDAWDVTKSIVGDLWEVVKAGGAIVGFVAEWLVQSGALKTTLEAGRLIIAGFKDGVEILGASFAYVGSVILQALIAPLANIGDLVALIVSVADKDLGASIQGTIDSVRAFAETGEKYAAEVAARFANGESAVMSLGRELEKTARDQAQLNEALKGGSISAGDAARESARFGRAVQTKAVVLKAAASATKEQEAAAKKLATAYAGLVGGLDKALAELEREITLGRELNEAEKARIAFIEELDGKYKGLTVTQMVHVDSLLEEWDTKLKLKAADEARLKTMAAVAEHSRKLTDTQMEETDTLRAGNVSMAEQLAALTLTEAQRARLEAQTLRNTATDKEWQAAMEGGNYHLSEQARLLRERADMLEQGIAVKEAKAAGEEWQKTVDSINTGLTDALMRAFESGKGFMEAFRSTLVNAFKTLVLQPTIKAVLAPVTGAVGSLLGGNANAATGQPGASGGGFGGLLSSVGNFFNGSSLTNAATFGAQDLGAWLMNNTSGGLNSLGGSLMGNSSTIGSVLGGVGNGFAGYGISKALSGGYSAGSAVNTIAGIASMIPAIGPIAGVIGAVINRAFGRKPKEYTEQGITGTIGGGDFTGEAYKQWKQKGGWLRSDKTGRDTSAVSAEIGDALDLGANTILTQVKAYADALKLPGDALGEVSQQITIKLTDDAKANQAAITAALQSYSDALTVGFEAAVKPFQQEGETLLDTMGRLGESLAAVNPVLDTLELKLFDISAAGGDAASKLLALFEGIEQFGQAAETYYTNFFTEEERAAKLTEALTAELDKLGLAMPVTRDEFRQMVEVQDLTTESGRNAFAALLKMSGAIADLIPAADSATAALEGTADAAGSVKGGAAEVKLTASDVLADLSRVPGVNGGTLTAKQQARLDADPVWVEKQAAWGGQLPAVITGALKNFFVLEEKQRASERAKWASLPADPRFSGQGMGNDSFGAHVDRTTDEDPRRKLMEEQVATTRTLIDALAAMSKGLRDLEAELRGSALDPRSPEAKYLEAQAEMDALGRQALTGDMAAAEAFKAQLSGFLQQSQAFNASGAGYVGDFTKYVDMLATIADKLDKLGAAASAQIRVQQEGFTELIETSSETAKASQAYAETARAQSLRGQE